MSARRTGRTPGVGTLPEHVEKPRCEACGQFTRKDGFCTSCDADHDHACCPPDDCCGGPCAAHPCWELTT